MNLAMPRLSWAKSIEMLLWLAALGVLVENVSLLRQNRRLQEAVAPQIAAGAQLQMLSGLTLDGRLQSVPLPSSGSKLLIFTFSPGCPACQANQDGWMQLVDAAKQKEVRVLWVSRDPIHVTRDYCIKHGIAASDVLADPPNSTVRQLRLMRVPNSVLVGAGGVVERVWPGQLDQASFKTLSAYFSGPTR